MLLGLEVMMVSLEVCETFEKGGEGEGKVVGGMQWWARVLLVGHGFFFF